MYFIKSTIYSLLVANLSTITTFLVLEHWHSRTLIHVTIWSLIFSAFAAYPINRLLKRFQSPLILHLACGALAGYTVSLLFPYYRFVGDFETIYSNVIHGMSISYFFWTIYRREEAVQENIFLKGNQETQSEPPTNSSDCKAT